MLTVTVKNDMIQFGDALGVHFNRTLRIPESEKVYNLPPGCGRFPVKRVEDYLKTVPESWKEHGGVFIPMYQREALWVSFTAGKQGKPCAVKLAIGKINAVSGKPWNQELNADEADYMVAPDPQHWLDGINGEDGIVRQFIAMPLGMGYTVEGQLTGEEKHGGIQLRVFAPKPGKFPDSPLSRSYALCAMGQGSGSDLLGVDTFESFAESAPMASMGGLERLISAPKAAEMGLAAGGKIDQKIYPDPHGLDTWDEANSGRCYIHIVNSQMYEQITGEKPPETPISASTYASHGFPWFDLYDEHAPALSASEELGTVKSVSEMDKEKGFAPQQDDTDVDDGKVVTIPLSSVPGAVTDGKW